eukprot:CAMPEP_0185034492 /NCGR_PEP_ID=MMETSP1103-20130426/24443_1 /TAXON_ID=36769 /ORGANISM="Paraphysomonas bandaiensis, Strain Caron Lab Isolate" /LENGTH=1644 /DNA_ID=CAMNT_0027571169 /DNA_START=197 /DNA_END=5132 /DNA_ORIENTATION=+
MIALNSLLLGMSDYSNVDSKGDLVAEGSWRNTLIDETELLFTIVFTIECVLKVFGMGFFGKKGYLHDRWNWLDFVVVVTGWMSYIPGIPNISVLRTFRVLRPLKSISSNPGLQSLVVSILNSIPQLVGVLVLLFFVFVLFGIAGMQMFSGPYLHARCRLTPYPVNLSYTPGTDDYAAYRCLDEPNFNELKDEEWKKGQSPWATARDCYWPLDYEDTRLCSFSDDGYHKCPHGTSIIPRSEWRWCGSNYDAKGNARFRDSKIMAEPTYIRDLNWGYTHFDDIGSACLTIFQAITLEGWVTIMYFTQDAINVYLGAVIFIILVLFGAFFVLNLLLAVLEDNFTQTKSDVKAAKTGEALLKKVIDRVFPYDIPLSDEWMERRSQLRSFVESSTFSSTVIGLIILNTISLALDHYPINDDFGNTLDAINFLLALVFTVEMILKLIALGLFDYVKDPSNVFDAVIVIVSFVELVAAPPLFFGGSESYGGGAISAMRSFRLFRIFKLVAKWKSMKKLLGKVIKTVFDLGNFGLLLFLFLYIYTLVGMQFFANRFRFDEEGYAIEDINSHAWKHAPDWSRSNFDDFTHSFATVFQVLTTEDWNGIMYDCRRSLGSASVIYTCTLIIFGNYIFMNLFLAILLGNFASDDEDEEFEQVPSVDSDDEPMPDLSPRSTARFIADKKAKQEKKKVQMTKVKVSAVIPVDTEVNADGSVSGAVGKASPGKHASETTKSEIDSASNVLLKSQGEMKDDDENSDIGPVSVAATETIFPLHPERTLGIFGPTNIVRRCCAHVVADKRFDQVILVLIIISSIVLAVDNPLLNPESNLARVLSVLDITLTMIFTAEMVIKVIALGFILGDGAYLRTSWNVLDFIVVVISLIGTFSNSNSQLTALRSLRALRGLRPLRVINRAPGLKIVVNAMFASIPDVMNVVAFCFLFFLIFSIFGVNYFKGMMRSCQGDVYDNSISQNSEVEKLLTYPKAWEKLTEEQASWFGPNSTVANMDCSRYDFPNEPCCSDYPLTGDITSKMLCRCWGGDWDFIIDQSFDNVGVALLAFFQMSTTEGWVDIMYSLVDSAGIDMQPIRDNQVEWIYFSIFFMMIGSYLALNLFVGVVIDNFNKMKAKVDGNLAFLTPEQQEWIKTQEIARRLRPTKKQMRPEEFFAGMLFDICFHPWFEWFIMYSIIANTIIMGMEHFGQSEVYGRFLETMNTIFAIIFTIEAVIKISSLKQRYFTDSWNRFDLLVVVGTDVGLVFLWVSGSNIGLTVTILRTFRIARLLRLMNGTESINQLFNTLLLTLPGLGNIAALLTLLFFIYAVMGVQLFAKVQFNDEYNEHANFRDFGIAMISLLRFSTGENWNGFLYDAARRMPGCEDDPDYDSQKCGFNDRTGCEPLNGCGSIAIYPYMLSFTVIITFVFLNLFIGVILEGFSSADDSGKAVKPEDFIRFADHWSIYDPNATCYITVEQLEDFVQTLFTPLGFGEHIATHKELMARISRLNLHIFSGKRVHFKDVLSALSTEAIRRASENKGGMFGSLPYASLSSKHGWDGVEERKSKKRTGILSATLPPEKEYTMAHLYAARRIEVQVKRLVINIKRKREEEESKRKFHESDSVLESVGEMDHSADLTNESQQEENELMGDIASQVPKIRMTISAKV